MKKVLKSLLAKLYVTSRKFYHENLYNSYRQKYEIARSFKFNGFGIQLYGEGKIYCGENSYIGSDCFLQSVEGEFIRIGKNCAISHNVKIYTSSYLADQDFSSVVRKTKKGSVEIGDGVWIGVNVLINPGVSIGNNSVVGANSVVTKNIPQNAIYGGVPARFIRNKSLNLEE